MSAEFGFIILGLLAIIPFLIPLTCTTVAEVAEFCGDNEPGVKEVWVIANDDLTFPLPAVDADPNDNTISTDLVLVGTDGFKRWRFLLENAFHTETANDNGTFDHDFKLVFPKDEATKRNQFRKMYSDCCRYTIVYVDGNEMPKLVDTLKFVPGFNTGEGPGSRNEWEVHFQKSGRMAYHYTGTIPQGT